ncbi:SatD family protein [Arsenicicoccus sp. oral taxon 190]|uniref:SatD family protein n=1 Tax=Arsenicicoccus sp. oral taxon 190 TaxID=1658671 RepID=UPI000679FCA3|nr:SatD family protein [Arsenicicoccus sp. oral taxon 190]AKT50347.1 hypothetical protein ADJ73_01685 [Arsenicicoccus sp. oral taxon 190]
MAAAVPTPSAPFTGAYDAVALLGDLVASRAAPDRGDLHQRLTAALSWVDDLVPPLDPLVVTVADEFQGVYATAGDAVLASLLVRLALLPAQDVRCGIGRGEVRVIDASRTPALQDGSAWWAARAAIEEAERRAGSPATRGCRTWYLEGERGRGAAGAEAGGGGGGAGVSGAEAGQQPDGWPSASAIQALLVLRDELVSHLDDRPLRVLRGVMSDLTQTMVAEQEGITQSAVSQLISRGGLAAVKEAHAILRRPVPSA